MYFPQLVFARFIAAMIVVFGHFAAVKEVTSIPLVGNFIYNSNSLLSYFFVLTGFVLVSSLAPAGVSLANLPARPFWFKRVTRLYPIHWLALLLTIGLVQAQVAYDPATYRQELSPGRLLAHVLLLQAWYPTYSFALAYNYVSWTLSVDLLLTLLAPLFYNWLVTLPTPVLLRRVGMIWLISLVLHAVGTRAGIDQNWLFYWPPVHIPEFMIGMAGGLVVVRHPLELRQYDQWIHWGGRISLVAMLGLTMAGLPMLYKNSLYFAPLYLFAILSGCLSTHWITRLFCRKPLQHLGKISYTVFILQIPVAIVVLYFLKEWSHWHYRYLWPIYALTLVGAAALAHEWLEKPISTTVNNSLRQRIADADTNQPQAETAPVSPA